MKNDIKPPKLVNGKWEIVLFKSVKLRYKNVDVAYQIYGDLLKGQPTKYKLKVV